jgi:hypothetical protein
VSKSLSRLCFAASTLLLACSVAHSQITNITNDQSAPTQGVGHEYIQMLNETVSPSNGSVSLRLEAQTPLARGISIPFGFTYDSGGVIRAVGTVANTFVASGQDTSFLQQNGWGYAVPRITDEVITAAANAYSSNGTTCQVHTGFVFSDSSGERHALGLALANQTLCTAVQANGQDVTVGGDDTVYAWTTPSAIDSYPYGNVIGPISIQDSSGTLFHFQQMTTLPGCTNGYCGVPDFIEDRNGNKIVFALGNSTFFPVTATDTAGRLPELPKLTSTARALFFNSQR